MGGTFVIAEIGQAHEGSLGILHSYIDAVAKTGVDAIKFQTHIAEAESSIHEPFRVKFSYEDETRFDYWKRMGFTKKQWAGIKSHCDEVGLEFMSSPFSIAAVELLEELGVKRYKVGSGEVSNFLMLEHIVKTGKEIILSSGMSSFEELDETVSFLKERGGNYSILQCTTQYPTKAETVGLNVIQELKDRYDVKVGFSDHSSKPYTSIAAVAKGAEIVEFHVVFNKSIFGPDSKSSLTLEETKELVEGIRYIDTAAKNPVQKSVNEQFKELKTIFEKSLAVNKQKKVGEIVELKDLESKKPANQGIPAKDYDKVVGKKVARDLETYSFLNWSDLSD
jgi:N-acetylneuraminate synthase